MKEFCIYVLRNITQRADKKYLEKFHFKNEENMNVIMNLYMKLIKLDLLIFLCNCMSNNLQGVH